MCTNRALVDSLECYMDDLVDCFEDFVKKSIVVISLAVGVLVGLIAYTLKIITDQSNPTTVGVAPGGTIQRNQREQIQNRSDTSLKRKRSSDTTLKRKRCSGTSLKCKRDSGTSLKCKRGKTRKRSVVTTNTDQDDKGTSTICKKPSCLPCSDEKVLKNIGFPECSNTDCGRKNRKVEKKVSNARISIPSLPTSDCEIGNKDYLGPETAKDGQQTDPESCCSMCCDDNCDE